MLGKLEAEFMQQHLEKGLFSHAEAVSLLTLNLAQEQGGGDATLYTSLLTSDLTLGQH